MESDMVPQIIIGTLLFSFVAVLAAEWWLKYKATEEQKKLLAKSLDTEAGRSRFDE